MTQPGPSKVTLMLAQFARATPDGCIDVLGAGWTQIPEGPILYYIAGLLEFPWESGGIEHTGYFDLLDDQGAIVSTAGPDGEASAVRLQGTFNVAPNAGLQPGTPLGMPFVMGIEAPPLRPGRYEWRLQFDGRTEEDWRLGFNVVPAAGPQGL